MAFNEPAWDPSEEDIAPVRGRHRLQKQRTISRGSVLGVATIAAVGAGGVATAEGKSPVSVSMPDMDLPDFAQLPGLGHHANPVKTQTASRSGVAQVADAGELLRTRILAQADQQHAAADAAERKTVEKQAADTAAKEAAARKVREAAAKKAEEKAAAAKAEAERQKKEAERKAALAKLFVLPTTNYHLTAGFGQAGTMWAADHTGLDFAAPTGTAVRSVAAGEITSAGWAGSYGYRIVVTHADGTQTWYCHLSSMVRTSGAVATGDTIGRVGATGNVTGPHLHLEVRPGGGDPVDPLPWLRDKGLNP